MHEIVIKGTERVVARFRSEFQANERLDALNETAKWWNPELEYDVRYRAA
jgi:hypothetical protein